MELMDRLGKHIKLPKAGPFAVRAAGLYLLLLLLAHMPFWFDKGVDPSHPLSLLLAGFFIAYRLFFVLIVPMAVVSWLWDRIGSARRAQESSRNPEAT